ncbi:hypothetical protein HPP92_022887 [Vanilla planifolia]|uniref:Uncharacterized protein n=1 Tax=Vanilla planifolia TaxID=51239 RepID=A0A835UE89_VANPL|nr:hypothetical protein HPP92_022887 [Vanilla planifolia]
MASHGDQTKASTEGKTNETLGAAREKAEAGKERAAQTAEATKERAHEGKEKTTGIIQQAGEKVKSVAQGTAGARRGRRATGKATGGHKLISWGT